jgi:hypothetical protein
MALIKEIIKMSYFAIISNRKFDCHSEIDQTEPIYIIIPIPIEYDTPYSIAEYIKNNTNYNHCCATFNEAGELFHVYAFQLNDVVCTMDRIAKAYVHGGIVIDRAKYYNRLDILF